MEYTFKGKVKKWQPHNDVAVYLRYAKSWAEAAAKYRDYIAYSSIKGRALFNMKHLVARITKLSDKQLESAEDVCMFVMANLYCTERGNYNEWESALYKIHKEMNRGEEPASVTEGWHIALHWCNP